jgi:hypothetical protein
MPNWTINKLVISHNDASKISLLKEGALNDHLFDSLIPMPEEIKSTEDGWYAWSLQNWGTKWDACEISIQSESANSLCLMFETPWSSPYMFLKRLAKEGYQFLLCFADEGAGFGLISDESISLDSERSRDAERMHTICNEQLVMCSNSETLEDIQAFIGFLDNLSDKSILQSFLNDLGLQSTLDCFLEEENT